MTFVLKSVKIRPILPAWIAQLVEQGTENPCVGGPIPSPGTIIKPPLRRRFCCCQRPDECLFFKMGKVFSSSPATAAIISNLELNSSVL